MASLVQLLRSIFLFTILISTFIINGNSTTPSISPCSSFSCGDGLQLEYPFYQQSQQTNHCGYPSLGVSCIGKIPIIQLHNYMYRVKEVNHSENTVVVTFFDLNDMICPMVSHGVVLNSTSSFLNYTSNVKMAYFFYNCTVYPPGVEYIKCLQIGARHAYAFMEGSVPEFDWKGHCESIVTIPMMGKGIDGSLANNYGKALQEGFELKWKADLNCRSCESSGGFCEYGDGARPIFSCSCNDGRHHANCHDGGGVSKKFKPDLLSIGLFGSVGFMIAVTVLYVVWKKKNGVHKRGFNPIPMSGK